MHPEMTAYRVVIHRGGTSKGIFIKENELPREQPERDRVIRAIFGSPDPRQIDGLGGAEVLTSKLAVIGPSTRPDADVDYTFAQVSFDNELVDYGGNCGNISAAVGPFAIDEGLVPAVEPVTRVRIHQVNTNCILIADVPVKQGKACVNGDCTIDGVPGTGARILLDFADTVGSTTGRLLPTGNPVDLIQAGDYGEVEVSIVDAGNVLVFVEPHTLGLIGTESCAEIESNAAVKAKMEAIRAACTVKIGLAQSPEQATKNSPYAPFFAIVSPPQDYESGIDGRRILSSDIDLTARLSFMLHMHKTYPGTGTVCTGAAARIPGTLVHRQLSERAKKMPLLRIGHPGGVIPVVAERDDGGIFQRLSYERTARRIMEGMVYINNDKA
ncbi:PrpF domain-containing protein [Agathobaculum sp. NTUH-O15-33]|uniref:2-methylaconitate cis-trans isomerase PrpF family protein n=1 Tax=Agathobaculum sp. NTUH-O15-33 TaxID=3079302 RepID=UPI00295868B0|nr:PrpF domain-containing protein [Agathobaculum sp. NTUH-O15-33]WNX85707.1 PrpF domain-containing protein [Agathobaculum sp. NTUH-O15-33]